jgi:methyl-accepting chemotaxis protein
MFRRLAETLFGKLILLSLGVSFIPIAIVGYLGYDRGHKALEKSTFERLEAVAEGKALSVEAFFANLADGISLFGKRRVMHQLLDQLTALESANPATPQGNAADVTSEAYAKVASIANEALKGQLAVIDASNLYLVCAAHGHILYEWQQESDLGTDLRNGPYRDSAMAGLWSRAVAQRKVVFTDYVPHAPSKNALVLFAGAPMFDEQTGVLEGVLIIRVDLADVATLLDRRTGMGETGDSYLVGADLLMRTQSHFEKDVSILRTKVDTLATRAALDGKKGHSLMKDYRGIEVLSAYEPLAGLERTTGLKWIAISEIDESEAFAPMRALATAILIAALLTALLVVAFAFLSARGIAVPLRHQRDEIARASDSLGAAAAQVLASVAELAASVQQTAAAVSETTATTEEVKQTTLLTSEKSRQMEENAKRSSLAAGSGVKATDETVQRMKKLQDQIGEIASRMIKLSEKSQAIARITGTVGELADQSNLLAVNAAIEAAKAGEHGKGFAVVAQEVRLLAERSKQATAEIRTILDDMERSTTAAVMATEQGTKAVEAGMQQAIETGDMIRSLARAIDDSAMAASQILATSRQQLMGMDQTTGAMESIKQASSQNAVGTRQIQDAAVSLKQVGEALKVLVAAHKL